MHGTEHLPLFALVASTLYGIPVPLSCGVRGLSAFPPLRPLSGDPGPSSSAAATAATPVVVIAADPGQREALLGQGQLGSRASAMWALLRTLLRRHDMLRSMPDGSSGGVDGGGLLVHGGCLREAVADAILRVDRRLGLPVWLLQLFTVRRLGVCPGCMSWLGEE